MTPFLNKEVGNWAEEFSEEISAPASFVTVLEVWVLKTTGLNRTLGVEAQRFFAELTNCAVDAKKADRREVCDWLIGDGASASLFS